MSDIHEILDRLGLCQYADCLVAEGFDSWETLTDITESDLNHLGVKLGHRRKLQRAIADHRQRFQTPSLPIAQTVNAKDTQASTDGQSAPTSAKKKQAEEPSTDGAVRAKRKYRRHPKPDPHAPERPPSAYVLFSNYMRDLSKNKDYTFTEMAKIVGEKWQELPASEREKFEGQASGAKEKYLDELALYKKTDHYAQHMQYLADFKAKANTESEGKRTKLRRDGSTQSSHESQEAMFISRVRQSSDSADSREESMQNDGNEMTDGVSIHPRSQAVAFPDHYPYQQSQTMLARKLPPYSDVSQSTLDGRSATSSTISGPNSQQDTPTLKSYHTSRSPSPHYTRYDHTIGPTAAYIADAAVPIMPEYINIEHSPRYQTRIPPLHTIMEGSSQSRRILPIPRLASPTILMNESIVAPTSGRTTPVLGKARTYPESSRPIQSFTLTTSTSLPERISPLVGSNDSRSNSIAALLRAGEELAARDEEMTDGQRKRAGIDRPR